MKCGVPQGSVSAHCQHRHAPTSSEHGNQTAGCHYADDTWGYKCLTRGTLKLRFVSRSNRYTNYWWVSSFSQQCWTQQINPEILGLFSTLSSLWTFSANLKVLVWFLDSPDDMPKEPHTEPQLHQNLSMNVCDGSKHLVNNNRSATWVFVHRWMQNVLKRFVWSTWVEKCYKCTVFTIPHPQ